MNEKRTILNERKQRALEAVSRLPPKDLLLAQLHHMENPPENAEIDCNPFDQSNLDHSSLESIISNTYSDRLERDIAICHSLLIHSKLCILDEEQQSVTNQLRKQLRTIFEYREDRSDFDREYEDQYFLMLEEMCVNLPALLPNLIPINQTNLIMNHKDEGFLFRKVEEILSGMFEFTEMSEQVKYLQIVVDKLQTEFQCLKTHEHCVDLKLIRDVVFSLSVLLDQDVKEYSRYFVNFGILDLLADYLTLDPNEGSIKILDDILSVNGFIVRLYSELAATISEDTKMLSDWFLGGRSISAIISRLLKEVDKLSKELARNLQEEVVDILDEDCDYHQQGLIVKYSLYCLLELSRKGLLQKYLSKSMNAEQDALFQVLLGYLWNMLADKGRIILVKIVANVVDIPKLTNSLLDDSCLLGCLFDLLESRESFIHAMYIFVQLSWYPHIVSVKNQIYLIA
ncbi:predicted protein [Naegleria gruberi]|uniref:Predicted protein n=1 Tax=Naegleria gruberi TaxID=5762 RepID=D2VAL6_NAEGR|nr:uncharacterized protein NAEGRDRAFT_47987 [Naegleria gruberi]EFC46098.1 predicted protein [Naegleria gruberi]|eukprot:XP_002678842.1 predicted protein [Naegleria gruberi strain NEG-M]